MNLNGWHTAHQQKSEPHLTILCAELFGEGKIAGMLFLPSGRDPAYVELIGGKWPDYQIPGEFCGKFVGDDKAREMNTETARREEWRSRTPHGTCVEIFPTDYETEKAYQEAVAHAYSLTHRGL